MANYDMRNLGYFETLLYYAHQRGASQFTLALELSGDISVSNMVKGFEVLFHQHPLLRAVVLESEGALTYQLHQDFSMIPVSVHNDGDIQAICESVRTKQMDLSQYNWSVDIVTRGSHHYHLLIHMSHVILDGLSFVQLIEQWLAVIDNLCCGSRPANENLYMLYPPVEILLEAQCKLERYFSEQQTVASERKVKKVTGDTSDDMDCFIQKSLTVAQTDALTHIANSNDVKMNDLLCAAVIKAFYRLEKEALPVIMGGAVNLRNKSIPKVPSNVLGNFFTALSVNIEAAKIDASLIDLARHYRAEFGQALSKQIFLPSLFHHKDMVEMVKGFMMAPIAEESLERLGSSYMGPVNLASSVCNVESFQMLPKRCNGNNLMSYIFKGALQLMFCFSPDYRTKQWAQKLANLTSSELVALL